MGRSAQIERACLRVIVCIFVGTKSLHIRFTSHLEEVVIDEAAVRVLLGDLL